LAVILAAVGHTQPALGQPNRANQAQLRWYDAYQQAVAAVQRGDWVTAEGLLQQAQSSGTKPGRRVFAYGDYYVQPFIPDYYLGLVYLNTKRDREAEAAFARVRSLNLIGPKDAEYAAFERQTRQATFNRAMNEGADLLRKGDLAQANNRAEEARATKIDDVRAGRLAFEIGVEMEKLKPKPADTTAQAPVQQSPPSPVQTPAGTVAGGLPNTATVSPTAPKTNVPPPPVGRVPPRGGAPPGNETFDTKGVIFPRPTALRDGLLAFFSGDYGGAIPLLTAAAGQPGANPRALVFLACAKAGLVLIGGGDAEMLREARAAFQRADVQRTITAADRRFISPRVLQQLEIR
jgi:hypothetical protein